MLNEVADGCAGLHLVAGETVDFHVAPVADHHAAILVEQHQALRHVVEGGIEVHVLQPELMLLCFQKLVLSLEAVIQNVLLGDVLMRGNPSAAGNRMVAKPDDASVGKRVHVDGRGLCRDRLAAFADVVLGRGARIEAFGDALL
jgi:hypothetical protein